MSKNQNYEEYQDQDDNRPLSIEEQRARLRQLIIMGKERGYITYSEINDALPDDMSDAEQIDNIVSMISGLGIQVTEQAPDAEDILLSDNAAALTDDDAVEEAEAATEQIISANSFAISSANMVSLHLPPSVSIATVTTGKVKTALVRS